MYLLFSECKNSADWRIGFMKKTFSWFRKIALAEGISFLVLLFIAMPLKHFAGMPLAVTIVGGLHGVLFVAFIILAWEVKGEYKKDFKWMGKAVLASLLPFGTIYMDREWRKEEV
jgi:integral membrane protein